MLSSKWVGRLMVRLLKRFLKRSRRINDTIRVVIGRDFPVWKVCDM
jgi:hypothetical protein